MAVVVSLRDHRRKQARKLVRLERDRVIMAWLRPLQLAQHDFATCKSLWAGVLIQAVVDFEGMGHYGGSCKEDAERRKRIRGPKEAREWFEQTHDRVGGFEWICAHLDLDADTVREKLFHGRFKRRRRYIRDPRLIKAS